jgi:glucokinase
MGSAVRLVGDIGGTNARFALVDAGSRQPRDERTVKCADYPGLEQAIRDYLLGHGSPPVVEIALDVATGITGDFVHLTNGPWGFSIEQTRKAFGLSRLHVINDFTALALAVPTLTAAEVRKVGGGAPVPATAIAVIGAGTGLGVSGLIPDDGGWRALQGEGGHTSFSPTSPREAAVLQHLWRTYEHVSTERVLSGMGLENLYRSLCEIDGRAPAPLDPAGITRAGLEGRDAHCREALDMFCAILGAAAANLVVTLGAFGGCYIGGGIVPRFGTYFDASPFRARFENKGRFRDYVAAVPTYVIEAATPALRGLATLFDES